jgi:hypothetical protein
MSESANEAEETEEACTETETPDIYADYNALVNEENAARDEEFCADVLRDGR